MAWAFAFFVVIVCAILFEYFPNLKIIIGVSIAMHALGLIFSFAFKLEDKLTRIEGQLAEITYQLKQIEMRIGWMEERRSKTEWRSLEE